MFVTEAFAQAAPAVSPTASLISTLLPILAIILVMYVLVFRPQRKAMRDREQMIAAIARGDTVITGGGLVGKVTHVHDDIGEIDVDVNGTKLRAVRAMVADVRNKTASAAKPVADKAANDETDAPKVKSRTRR